MFTKKQVLIPPGLYFYDNDVAAIAAGLNPAARGELDITAVKNAYLAKGDLKAKLLGRGFAWLDTGTHEFLLQAANFIRTIEKRQGLKIGCIEEEAFNKGLLYGRTARNLGPPITQNPLMPIPDQPADRLNSNILFRGFPLFTNMTGKYKYKMRCARYHSRSGYKNHHVTEEVELCPLPTTHKPKILFPQVIPKISQKANTSFPRTLKIKQEKSECQ